MRASGVIDLGSDWTLPREAPRPRTRIRRRYPLVALIAAVVLLLGGSTEPGQSLTLVATLPPSAGDPAGGAGSGEVAVGGGFIYTTSHAPRGRGVITAYRLPGGRPLWSVSLADWVTGVIPVPRTGVLLAETYQDALGRQHVSAIDETTGRLLWQSPRDEYVADVLAGQALLTSGPASAPVTLRLVAARTGATVWSATAPGGTDVTISAIWMASADEALSQRDGPALLVLRAPKGPVRVLDERSGRTVASATLDPPPPFQPGSGPPGQGQSIVGDEYLLTFSLGNLTVVAAYALDTLARRWQTTLNTLAYYVTDCGSVLCVSGRDCGLANCVSGPTDSLTALDPATGAVRWHTARWSAAMPVGGDLLAFSDRFDSTDEVVDPATGRPLLRLDQWSPVGSTMPGAAPVLAAPGSGGQGDWFALLDGGQPGIRPLGFVPGVAANLCRATPVYLVCDQPGGGLRVWRYQT